MKIKYDIIKALIVLSEDNKNRDDDVHIKAFEQYHRWVA